MNNKNIILDAIQPVDKDKSDDKKMLKKYMNKVYTGYNYEILERLEDSEI